MKKDLFKQLNELSKHKDWQENCRGCRKSMFYMLLSKYGRCLACADENWKLLMKEVKANGNK